MKLFDTVKKKVTWLIGATTVIAGVAYPFLPPEYRVPIEALLNVNQPEVETHEQVDTDI